MTAQEAEQMMLLQSKLELETIRRQTAEARLEGAKELAVLREAHIAARLEEAEAARTSAYALHGKYKDEAYRNGEAVRKSYEERHSAICEKLEKQGELVRELRAALSLKEKELCELKGGCT
jgi:hypothetical protein